MRSGLLQKVDDIVVASVHPQGVSENIYGLVYVIVIASDLNADPRSPHQTAQRRCIWPRLGRLAARDFGKERLRHLLKRRVLRLHQQVASFLFQFA